MSKIETNPEQETAVPWTFDNNVPRQKGVEFEVLLKNGYMRRVRFNAVRDYWTLWFADCTNPLQNAICHDTEIVGWRSAPNTTQQYKKRT